MLSDVFSKASGLLGQCGDLPLIQEFDLEDIVVNFLDLALHRLDLRLKLFHVSEVLGFRRRMLRSCRTGVLRDDPHQLLCAVQW